MENQKKTITLDFTDYVIKGTAKLLLWGGDNGTIEMQSYHVNNLTEKEIAAGANDSGFGCERIVSIEVDIYENYNGYLVYLESREYNL